MSSNIQLRGLIKGEGDMKRQVYEVLEVEATVYEIILVQYP